jgi:hypothetical protein
VAPESELARELEPAGEREQAEEREQARELEADLLPEDSADRSARRSCR